MAHKSIGGRGIQVPPLGQGFSESLENIIGNCRYVCRYVPLFLLFSASLAGSCWRESNSLTFSSAWDSCCTSYILGLKNVRNQMKNLKELQTLRYLKFWNILYLPISNSYYHASIWKQTLIN